MVSRIFARPNMSPDRGGVWGLSVLVLAWSAVFAVFTVESALANAECVTNVSQIETASPPIKRAYEVFFKHGAKGLANKSGGSFIRLKALEGNDKHESSGQIWLQYLSTAFTDQNELEKKQGPIQVCSEDGMIRIDGSEISAITLKLDTPEKGCFLVDTFSLLSKEEKRTFCPGDVPALVSHAIKAAKSRALQE